MSGRIATTLVAVTVWSAVLAAGASGCGGGAHDAAQEPASAAGSTGRDPSHAGTSGSRSDEEHDADARAGASAAGASAAVDASTGEPEPPPRDAAADAADNPEPAPAKAFRLTRIALRDPHFFLGSMDITDTEVLGASVNGTLIADGLTMDFDDDGAIDVSLVASFASFDPAAATGQMRMTDARCPPDSPANCEPDPQGGVDVQWAIENRAEGSCLQPVADTTSDYSPAVTSPEGPCFVTTEEHDLTIDLGGIRIAMTACSVAAAYVPGAGERLVDGLIAGFVTDQSAMQAVLPDYLPLIAGAPVADFLKDGDGDEAHSPNGESGFWLYLNFEADAVQYDAP